MDNTTIAEEVAEDYRKILIEFYEINNMDPIIIEQIKEFDTEALLYMAARNGVRTYKSIIEQIKEEQKQH